MFASACLAAVVRARSLFFLSRIKIMYHRQQKITLKGVYLWISKLLYYCDLTEVNLLSYNNIAKANLLIAPVNCSFYFACVGT